MCKVIERRCMDVIYTTILLTVDVIDLHVINLNAEDEFINKSDKKHDWAEYGDYVTTELIPLNRFL